METISNDLETLKSFAEDFDVLAVRYKENLNLQEIVRYANQLKEQRKAKTNEAQIQETAPSAPAETKEETKPSSGTHGLDNAERDAADAFADILGQSAESPQAASVPTTRRYEVTAEGRQIEELEAFLSAGCYDYKALD